MATTGRRIMRPQLRAKPKAPTIQMPKTTAEWEKLMRIVLAKAEAQKDRRQYGLRKALADGKSERVLRMMGIIHLGDLPRVFPEKA